MIQPYFLVSSIDFTLCHPLPSVYGYLELLIDDQPADILNENQSSSIRLLFLLTLLANVSPLNLFKDDASIEYIRSFRENDCSYRQPYIPEVST